MVHRAPSAGGTAHRAEFGAFVHATATSSAEPHTEKDPMKFMTHVVDKLADKRANEITAIGKIAKPGVDVYELQRKRPRLAAAGR